MLSESDRQLLEAYLDDGLSVWEVQRLDTRLLEDAELSTAFTELRTQRLARVAAFQSAAPDISAAERFAESLIASVHKERRKRKMGRIVRPLAVAAACLMIGFSVGRVAEWGRSDTSSELFGDSHASSSNATPAVAPVLTSAQADTHLIIHSPGPQESGPFQVYVLDEAGNVVTIQKFSRVEDARAFAREYNESQARRQQLQRGHLLISDQF